MVLKNAAEAERREKLGGSGTGAGDFYYVPIDGQDGAFTMATRIELEPGASIGYHKHAENEEVYVIISGKGIYTENGCDVETEAGDVFLCRKGCSHGLRNTGSGRLVLGAAIAKRQ